MLSTNGKFQQHYMHKSQQYTNIRRNNYTHNTFLQLIIEHACKYEITNTSPTLLKPTEAVATFPYKMFQYIFTDQSTING